MGGRRPSIAGGGTRPDRAAHGLRPRRRSRGAVGAQRCDRVRAAVCLAALLTLPTVRAAPVSDWLDGHVAAVVDLYTALHQAPELSLEERETAARMAEELRGLGAEVTTGVGGHGVVGVIRNGRGPTVMLRADMDGLPVVAQTGLPYA